MKKTISDRFFQFCNRSVDRPIEKTQIDLIRLFVDYGRWHVAAGEAEEKGNRTKAQKAYAGIEDSIQRIKEYLELDEEQTKKLKLL